MVHTIKKINYAGWNDCVYLSNGVFEAVVSTQVGPRILRYSRVGGPNLFYLDEYAAGMTEELKVWRLYGGHTFDFYIDDKKILQPENAPVNVRLEASSMIFDEVKVGDTGISKQVSIRMCRRGGLEIKETLKNISDTPITVTACATTNLTPGGVAALPVTSKDAVCTSPKQADFRRTTFGNELCLISQDRTKQEEFELDFVVNDRWCSYFNDGCVFIITTPPEENYQTKNVGFAATPVRAALSTYSKPITLAPGESHTHTEVFNIFIETPMPETEDDAVKALNNNRYFYDFVKSPVKGLDY